MLQNLTSIELGHKAGLEDSNAIQQVTSWIALIDYHKGTVIHAIISCDCNLFSLERKRLVHA